MPLLAALPSWRQNAVSTFDALGWFFATLSCYLCSQRIKRHTDGIMIFSRDFDGLCFPMKRIEADLSVDISLIRLCSTHRSFLVGSGCLLGANVIVPRLSCLSLLSC